MLQHVRPRANQTHIAHKNIKKLRELIQTGFTNKTANEGNPAVVPGTCFRLIL
jgi:hypothetical protein